MMGELQVSIIICPKLHVCEKIKSKWTASESAGVMSPGLKPKAE